MQRCWAAVIWLLLSGLAVGYAYGVIRHRLRWPATLATVNTYAGLALLAVLIAANSPLLDFRKVSLASQVARVEAGELSWQDFGHYYARMHLGRPAYELRQRLLAGVAANDPTLRALVEDPGPVPATTPSEPFWETVAFHPARFEIPDSLKSAVEARIRPVAGWTPMILEADLDRDGRPEYVVLMLSRDEALNGTAFFSREGGGWEAVSLYPSERPAVVGPAIMSGEIRTVEPRFDDLEVGGIRFRMR